MKDFISEVLPQKEANCNLCDITYSLAFKKREWKDYLNGLDMESEFFFIEPFEKQYGIKAEYPCAFIQKNDQLTSFINAQEMNNLSELSDLIELVNARLQDQV